MLETLAGTRPPRVVVRVVQAGTNVWTKSARASSFMRDEGVAIDIVPSAMPLPSKNGSATEQTSASNH